MTDDGSRMSHEAYFILRPSAFRETSMSTTIVVDEFQALAAGRSINCLIRCAAAVPTANWSTCAIRSGPSWGRPVRW